MRIDAGAAPDALGGVAGDAVALHVARDAGVEVALGFPGVMARAPGGGGEDGRRRVEAAPG